MKERNELFELCEQVYKATGWYGSGSAWTDGTPIYSSDYILEKLPPIIERNCFAMMKDKNDRYEAGYAEYGSLTSMSDESDTPLKAMLKLTLRLHEEKIL